jgi:hypothetical protein
MAFNESGISHKSGSRWWRLDPRVAAHLRASASRSAGHLSAALGVAGRRGDAAGRDADPYAATVWADTEWSDTGSAPLNE